MDDLVICAIGHNPDFHKEWEKLQKLNSRMLQLCYEPATVESVRELRQTARLIAGQATYVSELGAVDRTYKP